MQLAVEITFNKTGKGEEVAVRTIRQIGSEAATATGAANGLTSSFGRMAAQVGVLAAAWKGFDALKSMITQGVQFNATLENSRLGMGAVISSMTNIADASGRALQGTEKLNAAMVIAGGVLDDARVMALKTSASFEQIIDATNAAMGPALGAKMNLAKGEIQKFVTAVTQMAGAVDQKLLQNGQLNQEIRGILEGDTSKNSRLAQILYGDVKDPKKTIERLKEEGKFYDFVMGKMKDYGLAGEKAANTFSGALSNLKDAFQQALGEGTQGQFGRVTQLMLDMTKSIVTFDEQGKATFNPQFVKSVESVADAFVSVASGLGQVAKAAPFVISAFTTIVNTAGGAVSAIVEGVFLAIESMSTRTGAMLGGLASQIQAHPILARLILGAGADNAQGGLRSLAGYFDRNAADASAARDAFGNMRKQYFDKAVSPWMASPGAGANAAANGLTVTGKPGAGEEDKADKAAQRAREAALGTHRESLAVLAAQGKQLDLQLRLAKETDPIKRAQLEADREVLAVLHKQAAVEREIRAKKNLTPFEQGHEMWASLLNTQKQIAIIREDEQKAQKAILDTQAEDQQKRLREMYGAELDWQFEQAEKRGEHDRALLEQTLELARGKWTSFYQSVGNGFKNAMASVLDGGGIRGAFGSFFKSIFDTVGANFATMIDGWMESLALAASGQEKFSYQDKETGQMMTGFRERPGGASPWAKGGMLALQAGSALYGMYTNPAPKKGQNMLSGAMAGASMGAMYGAGVASVYGAVIGAVIGAIAGAFAPTEKGKNVQILGTAAGLSISGMDSDWGADKLVTDINSAIKNTAEKMDAIFLGLPTAALQALGTWRPNLSRISVGGKADGKNWNEELDNYLKEMLPSRVYDAYGGAVTSLFNFLGVTDARVKEFAKYAGTLKTDEAIKALDDYIKVLSGFDVIVDMFGGIAKGGKGRAVNRADPFDIFQANAYKNADAGPMGAMGQIQERMAALSLGFDKLTHPEQVARASQILDLSRQFFEDMASYLTQLRDMQRGMNESVDQQIRDINYDQITDPKQRVEFVLAEQRRLRDELSKATNADEVNRLMQQIQQGGSQLYDLLGKNPAAAAQVKGELEDARKIANERYKEFFANAEKLTTDAFKLVTDILTQLQKGLDAIIPKQDPITVPNNPNNPEKPGGGIKIRGDEESANVAIFGAYVASIDASAVALDTHLTPSIGTTSTALLSFADGLRRAEARQQSAPTVVVQMGEINVEVTVAGTAERMIDQVSAQASYEATKAVISALQKQGARAKASGR